MSKNADHECGETPNEFCTECCGHEDTDGFSCLDCGADILGDCMALAYDRAKDARKYGDV